MNPYIYAIITAFLMSVGQILFKKAAIHIESLSNSSFLLMYILNYWFVGAVSLYVLSTFLWVLALTKMDVSILYPITSLGYVIVPILAFFIFSERITLLNFFGLVFIMIGILLAIRQ